MTITRRTATILFGLAGVLTALGGTAARAADQRATARADIVKKGYVEANGVNYYYEVQGKGEPLLLLHGGLGSTGVFEPALPALASGRQVIAVDLYGHGRTALTDRKVSIVDMGDDMATLLKKLGYDAVDVFGYSMGGGVALRLAVQHPERVRRLVCSRRRSRRTASTRRCCRSRPP